MAKEHGPALKNIYLTGFMCSGKTSAGRLLARRLGRPFADCDSLVEKKAGKKIAQIAAEQGMAAFRKLEAAQLKELFKGGGKIVALGGGVYPSSKWRRGLAAGITVFLYCGWTELEPRLKKFRAGRPLLAGPWAKASARAEKLYARRLPYYRRADITADISGLSPAKSAAAIAGALKKAGHI